MKEPPKIGALVHSLAGRDSGGYYLVVGYAGPRTVLVANGKNRPLKKPKKKNLRHLQFHHDGPASLAEKIRQRKARDEEIAQAIREMVGVELSGGEREGYKPDV
ncbi:MAG: RNA-binding protein [Firmicutes bacterium]|nr:RNA-binding protein [Bacillota bacterium]